MRPHERRQTAAYPYFKLAVWDERLLTWRDGNKAFADESSALQTAPLGTRVRLSRVEANGRVDFDPFIA